MEPQNVEKHVLCSSTYIIDPLVLKMDQKIVESVDKVIACKVV